MILMNDFKAEPLELREAMLLAVSRVLESGWYVLGNEVKHFEEQWAAVCGVDHGIGVGNGMDALEIALRALNIRAGDEVITTSLTFVLIKSNNKLYESFNHFCLSSSRTSL